MNIPFARLASRKTFLTKIGENVVKSIRGYDCNSLYAGCLKLDYPCSFPIMYMKTETEDTRFSIEKERYYSDQFIFLDYFSQRFNVNIRTKLTQGYELIDSFILNL